MFVWIHPKQKKSFKGSYVRFEVTSKGKTVTEFAFVLLPIDSKSKPITFNSYQDAKKAGWKKVFV